MNVNHDLEKFNDLKNNRQNAMGDKIFYSPGAISSAIGISEAMIAYKISEI